MTLIMGTIDMQDPCAGCRTPGVEETFGERSACDPSQPDRFLVFPETPTICPIEIS